MARTRGKPPGKTAASDAPSGAQGGTYRDDLEAAGERAQALERDLARAEEENQRLRRELEEAKNPPPPAPEPERERPPPPPEGHGLADEAERGRLIREAAERRTRDLEKAERQKKLRDAQRSFPRALTAWGYYARLGFLIWFPILVWGGMWFVYIVSQGHAPRLGWFAVPPIVGTLLYLLGRAGVAAAVKAEQAWLATIPFKVTGYELCFTGDGKRLKTVVHFKGKIPHPATVRDALLVLHPNSSTSDVTGTEISLSVPLGTGPGANPHTVNRAAHHTFHDVIALLMKIDAEYSIDFVMPTIV